jgi:peptidoglycan/LPS O-acetylase OafA/YrhL
VPGTTLAAESARGERFRPDVEGLRAVAVLLVVLDHLLGHPAGGFIGVDVFFVISGFLITGLLVGERERTGHISFRGFYARRARRILPVSILVLGATWLAARAIQLAGQAHQTGVDVVWSAMFLANVHFARISTDYFQHDTVHSPVQHYWSLAVEEQFYVVWPLVIVGVLALATRLRRVPPRSVLTGLLAVGVLASFGYSIRETRTSPGAAYFSTAGRAWELGVGALIALAVPQLRRLPGHIRAAGSVLGLAGVIASAFLLDGHTAFPGPGAALPVIAAAVLIASGAGGVAATAWPLTNPVSRYVGRVSYSLYLWHWPVLILLAALMPSGTTAFDVVAVAAMTACTVISYHYVEAPLRSFGWSRLRLPRPRRALAWPAVAAFACCMLAIAGWTAQPPQRIAAVPVIADIPASGALPAGQHLARAIVDAVNATRWPRLDPGLGSVLADRPREWWECNYIDPITDDTCTFRPPAGTASRGTVAVLGDSISVTWLPGLRAALVPLGWTVRAMTYMQCPASDVAVDPAVEVNAATFRVNCPRHRAQTYAALARLHPDLVVMSSAEMSLDRLVDKASGAAAEAEWRAGTAHAVSSVLHASPRSRVMVLSPPPAGANISLCGSQVSGPRPCVTAIDERWASQSRAERDGATRAGAVYLDSHLWFCTAKGLCPVFIDGHPVRLENYHLTTTWSRALAPLLAKAINDNL